MKTLLCVAAAVGLLACAGCSGNLGSGSGTGGSRGGDPFLFRTHFIGTEQLFSDTNAAKLKQIWQLPTAKEVRLQALDRFARVPFTWFSNSLAKGAPDQAALFRPLLDDVLTRESYLEARATPDLFLAIRLSEDRARVWQTNLAQVVAGWKLGSTTPVNADGLTGWEARKNGRPVVRVVRTRDWLLVSAGDGKSGAETNALAAIRAHGRPAKATGAWLDGAANLARLQGWLPGLKNYDNAPVAHFSLSNRAEFVRTLITFDFPRPHGWNPEAWQVPTNLVSEPVAHFLAMRGIRPVLEKIEPLRELGWSPMPNQVIGWGSGGLPFQFYYVAPARDVAAQLTRVEPRLRAAFFPKGATNMVGEIGRATNELDLIWRGLPIAEPVLGRLQHGGQEYVNLRLFPFIRTKTPPPPELFQQLSRENLVLFSFEITEARLLHWHQFYQIAEISTRRPLTTTNVPSQRFISDVGPLLGETVTEITSTSPTRMQLVRKSHSGLSAFELATLIRWMESSSFPGFGVFRPVEAKRMQRPPAPQPGR